MRTLFNLTIVPLAALTLVAAAHAQAAQQQSTCETWSTDKMTYVNVPCTESQQVGQAPAKNANANAKCGAETWSTDKMSYEMTPCSAGTTEENPGTTH